MVMVLEQPLLLWGFLPYCAAVVASGGREI